MGWGYTALRKSKESQSKKIIVYIDLETITASDLENQIGLFNEHVIIVFMISNYSKNVSSGMLKIMGSIKSQVEFLEYNHLLVKNNKPGKIFFVMSGDIGCKMALYSDSYYFIITKNDKAKGLEDFWKREKKSVTVCQNISIEQMMELYEKLETESNSTNKKYKKVSSVRASKKTKTVENESTDLEECSLNKQSYIEKKPDDSNENIFNIAEVKTDVDKEKAEVIAEKVQIVDEKQLNINDYRESKMAYLRQLGDSDIYRLEIVAKALKTSIRGISDDESKIVADLILSVDKLKEEGTSLKDSLVQLGFEKAKIILICGKYKDILAGLSYSLQNKNRKVIVNQVISW